MLSFLNNYLVDLVLIEGHHILPTRPCLEIVLPVNPVIVEELPWIGWDTEAENDDVELPQQ